MSTTWLNRRQATSLAATTILTCVVLAAGPGAAGAQSLPPLPLLPVPPVPGVTLPGVTLPGDQGARTHPGAPDTPGTTGATPVAKPPSKTKAYGRYCKGQSKKRAKGKKASAHSLCVKAMAKLAGGKTSSPHKACRGLSKRRMKKGKGKPSSFSRCVNGGKRLRRDLRAAAKTKSS